MAVTLSATINSSVRRFTVSGPLANLQPGDYIRLEDELLEFYGFQVPSRPSLLNKARLVCLRGALGTTPASHDSGTAVKGVALSVLTGTDEVPPAPTDGGGGGGGVTVLKGAITKDTPDLDWADDNPAKVFNIPAGSIVIRAFAVVTEAFDAGTIDLLVADASSPAWTGGASEDNKRVASYTNSADQVLGDTVHIMEEATGEDATFSVYFRRSVACVSECALWATVNQGPWLTGAADIYAIIATPVS